MGLIVGVASRVCQANGTDKIPAVRETLGRLASLEALIGGLVQGQIEAWEAWPEGFATPNRRIVYAALNWCQEHHTEIIDCLRTLAGAAPLAFEYNRAYCDIIRLRAGRYDMGLPVVNGAGEYLPFADASFDLVIAWDVVEHVQNPALLLAELARVLRPGGRVLLTVINRFAFRDPHYHLPLLNWLPRPLAEAIIERRGRSKSGADFSDRQRLSEMHYYTLGGFRQLAARYGFRVGDIREDRVRRNEGSAGGRKGQARDMLRRLGLARVAYIAYRSLFQGTYELLLVHN